jgi:hypothetical protein
MQCLIRSNLCAALLSKQFENRIRLHTELAVQKQALRRIKIEVLQLQDLLRQRGQLTVGSFDSEAESVRRPNRGSFK